MKPHDSLELVGSDGNTLKSGIDLVCNMINTPINTYGVKDGAIYFGYDKSEITPYYLPIVYDNIMVYETVKRFLEQFEPINKGGDGSYDKGFEIKTGDMFDHKYLFSIKFVTMYYGK